jgi:hypothetical protein
LRRSPPSRAVRFSCACDLLLRDTSLLPTEAKKSVNGFAPVSGPVEGDELFGISQEIGPRLQALQLTSRFLGSAPRDLSVLLVSCRKFFEPLFHDFRVE